MQLERGYLKLANRLVEAVLAAPFGGAQVRILLALVRLTYGWRRRTVCVSETQLAAFAGMAPGPNTNRAGGTFRQALKALVDAGVVRRVEGAKGSRTSTFAIQKNYTKWGAYAIADDLLRSRWDDRLPSDDAALRSMLVAEQEANEMARERATSDDDHEDEPPPSTWPEGGPPSIEETPEEHGPPSGHVGDEPEKPTWPGIRPPDGPVSGHVTPPKSLNGETYEGPKDRKDSVVGTGERDQCTNNSNSNGRKSGSKIGAAAAAGAAAGSAADEAHAYAVKLAVAANAAITERWGPQPAKGVLLPASQLASDLIELGVPVELATRVILSVLTAKRGTPPFTLEYFRQAIVEAHAAAEQMALVEAERSRQPGPPTPAMPVKLDAMLAARKRTDGELKALNREYEAERDRAVAEWSEHHEQELRTIGASVAKTYADFGEGTWVKTAVERQTLTEAAERAGFPKFDAWLAQRDQLRAEKPDPNETQPNEHQPEERRT